MEVARRTAGDPLRRCQIWCILRLQRYGQMGFGRPRRARLHRRFRHMPCLCAWRTMHLAIENPAYQFLHLWLCLLHQPLFEQCWARAFHAGRSRRGEEGTRAEPLSARYESDQGLAAW